jgi:hypothetical protein
MIIFNTFMIRKVFEKTRATLTQTSLSKKEYQFTFAVIAYDAFFLVFNFPLSVFYISYDINAYSGAFNDGDPVFAASYNVANSVTGNLSICVQNLSFFMYLFFNKLFRKKILSLIRDCYARFYVSRIVPSESNRTQNQTGTQ